MRQLAGRSVRHCDVGAQLGVNQWLVACPVLLRRRYREWRRQYLAACAIRRAYFRSKGWRIFNVSSHARLCSSVEPLLSETLIGPRLRSRVYWSQLLLCVSWSAVGRAGKGGGAAGGPAQVREGHARSQVHPEGMAQSGRLVRRQREPVRACL